MQIAQLFFNNSILIASRTDDFWCFLKELAGLHRILIGFCDLFRKILLKREKTARIIQKAAYKNRQHDSFACLLWYVRAVKDVFHVSVCDTSESSANAAQFRLRCQKSTRINQKTAKKQAARFLSPACFDMFEPSKAFSMFFYDASESECQRCTASIEKRKNSKNHPESCIQKQAARFLSPACFGNVWAVKDVFHVSLWCQRIRPPTLHSSY